MIKPYTEIENKGAKFKKPLREDMMWEFEVTASLASVIVNAAGAAYIPCIFLLA